MGGNNLCIKNLPDENQRSLRRLTGIISALDLPVSKREQEALLDDLRSKKKAFEKQEKILFSEQRNNNRF